MQHGIAPHEAADRVVVFQAHFDELRRKFLLYQDGESLFGLQLSRYPELDRIRKQLNLLQKLFQLYSTVDDFFL